MIVATDNLSKEYDGVYRVQELDIRIKEGDIYGFLGPNGAGKSTTMKMLLGLVKPTSGTIEIMGKPFNEKNRRDILASVGSLIESPSYYGHLTGRENMEIIRRLLDLPKKNIEEAVHIVRMENQMEKAIWFCKFTVVAVLMLAAILIQALVIVAYGNAVGIVEPLPVKTLWEFVLGTVMVTFVVVTIQVFFSLVFANQLVPMSIGMIGALIGFISTLLPTGIRNILIWGNYAEMMVLGQDTSSGNLQSSELVVRNIDFLPLTILFIVGLIAFVLFEKKFQKYEY